MRYADAAGATDTPNIRELSMKLNDLEVTIQQMIAESNNEPKESGKQKILLGWRDKLAKDPYRLPLHQIDEFVREVRNRLRNGSQQPISKSQAPLVAATAPTAVSLSR